ncbi:hypothetical protein CK203_064449 [Vitis vinifera]|uniref:Uncharacterized protein n=1 Tax=Vitis vinifera TaxID=29760 RepID=A0A438GRF8_VITVI|nr:hypothetical protein CK203_064449 [Vitis vinifera]
MGTLEIELLIGLTSFVTVFQKVKFIHDGQVVVVQSMGNMFISAEPVLEISHTNDNLFLTRFTFDELFDHQSNPRLRRVIWNPRQSNGKLKFMKNKLWSSIALCQSRSKYARKEQRREEKQSEENRGQQLQSSFTLLEYFKKSIFYILYTISKLRKSRINASNGARFGVETKELKPLQEDHSKLKEEFCTTLRNHPFVAR